MIVAMTPYCPRGEGNPSGRDLMHAYSECMDRLRPDDWAVFTDHDAMPTTLWWYRQMEDAIAENPDAGLFFPFASTAACTWQKLNAQSHSERDNMSVHRETGEQLARKSWSHVTEFKLLANQTPTGLCLLIRKKAWLDGGPFPAGRGQCRGADGKAAHRALKSGYKMYRLDGVYYYHRYSAQRDMTGTWAEHYESWDNWIDIRQGAMK